MRALLCPILVGRDAERALLDDALDDVVRGAGHLVVVAGEAGVGKSRLLEETAAGARRRGMVVLAGRALPRRAQLPLGPLAEALQPLAGQTELLDDPSLGPFRGVLTSVLQGKRSSAEPGGAVVVGEAVVRLLSLLGRTRGAVVVLEDLHWADRDTVDVVGYCADHLTDARVLCLASVRTGEDAPAERELRLLAERRAAPLVELARLDTVGTEQMLTACLGSEPPADVWRFIRDRSEGVPLFVEELLAGLAQSDALRRRAGGWEVTSRLVPRVPLTFAEAVQRRLDGLGTDGRLVLEGAALLGRSFDPALLPAATDIDAERVTTVLARAARAQLLAGDGTSFRHALSRDVVLAGLLQPRRGQLAGAVLDALEQAHPRLSGEWHAVAADLAEQAGRTGRAVGLLVTQAAWASSTGNLTAARAPLRSARQVAGDDPDLQAAVDEAEAQTAALAGEVGRAAVLATRVLPWLAEQPDGDRRRARLLAALARAAVASADWPAAQTHLDRLRDLLDGLDAPDLLATTAALDAQLAIALGDERRATASAAAALALAEASPAAACEAREVLGRLVRPKDVGAARAHFTDGLRTAEAHGLALWRARALHELGTIDLYTTQDDRNLLAARAAAIEAGAAATLALVELHLAAVAGARWQPQRGVEPAQRCVELSRRLSLATLPMGLLHLACHHALLGEEGEMERLCAEAREAALGDLDVEAGVAGRVRAQAALRRGAFSEALGHLDEAMTVLRSAPGHPFPFRGVWALLHEVVGDRDGAARAEARAHVDAGMPFNATALDLADAVGAGRMGEVAAAARSADEVLAKLRATSMGVWTAILLRLLGEAAIADGWGRPQGWLTEAAAIFDASRYAELASSCRAVLRRVGAPVPRRGRGDSEVPPALRGFGVTSREMDVLHLLDDGLTNRSIAERLHVSPRTVDRHVGNLLAKTGAADRRALAALLAEPTSR